MERSDDGRILLVDDDEAFRYSARMLLSQAGFRVVAASDFVKRLR